MTLNFPKSIYTAAEATTASISPANASPSDGDPGTIGSYGFTFDDDRVDTNGRWVMNSGSTHSLTGGATYTWDLYKWKASNIPDSSSVVQTNDNPSDGEVLTYDGTLGVNVWSAASGGVTVKEEGTALTTDASSLNFVGNGVVASGTGADKTITITDTNTTYSVGDGGLTQKNFTTTLKTHLDSIEASADVTDATNVAAAGAVMEGDTTTASMSFVVDEDNMSSNSNTKVPTQQSVKAYVDANAGGISNVVEDTTPELGGDLYDNGKSIVDANGDEFLAFNNPVTGGSDRHFVLRNGNSSTPPTIVGRSHSGPCDIRLSPDGTGSVDVDSSKIINVTDPTSASDAATKAYVDANAGGGGIASVADDTDPQLGGDLDLNSNNITGVGDIEIKSTDTGSAAGPILNLYRDKTGPADDDDLGRIQFLGHNAANQVRYYATIESTLLETQYSPGEAGQLAFFVRDVNAHKERLVLKGGGYSEFENADVCLSGVDLKFTGSTTNNSNYTTLTVVDPTQDNIITFPDATGTVILTSTAVDLTTAQTLENKTLDDYLEKDLVQIVSSSATHTLAAASVSGGAPGAHIHYVRYYANCTVTIDLDNGQSMLVMVSAASNAITWSATTLHWVGGSAPSSLNSTGYTAIEFWKVNNITYGALVGDVS